jgi:agmatine deiminase
LGAKALCGLNIELIELAVNDSWCRDSSPSFVCHPQQGLAGVSWRFNAWGGKSAHDLDEGLARCVLNQLGVQCFGTPLSNEGGAIHVDGEGTLITTESVLLNPTATRASLLVHKKRSGRILRPTCKRPSA